MASFANVSTTLHLPPERIIFGRSEVMAAVRNQLQRVATTNVPVLIQGESGTGKEIIARVIHGWSPWGDGPFVKVNCPAIAGTHWEGELFGSEQGAFTAAFDTELGAMEAVHRGTLFLDEIAELDLALQAKLSQLLQDGQFCRVGMQEDQQLDVRMVCATNRHLTEEIEAGHFRHDLFYRINVLSLRLPPLRERRIDIPDLAKYFLDAYNERYNCQTKPLSSQLLRVLQEHHWPGNIRELENVIKGHVILGAEEALAAEVLRRKLPTTVAPQIPLEGVVSLKKVTRQAVRELEREVILRSLQANNWNRKRVARVLSISYRALLYKIQDAGIGSPRSRAAVANAETATALKEMSELTREAA